ncbi:MAG: response regulator transcription factor [Clostridium sp.]|jgi:DNA-binding response OmpR family regulator|nr:response regulator transcription factor [Clostridium sp.]
MRLLLAEDERELSDVLVSILSRNQYVVDAVYDGESALEYGAKHEYDGIIMDVMMPKRNGLETLKALRERGVDTPLLILSAKSEVEDRVKGLDLGANDYLPKPFATNELLARIRTMTRRADEKKPHEIAFGNVTLDTSSLELSSGNASVRLSGKECKLMEILMTAAGKGVSEDQFLERVWENERHTESKAVWVYLSYLQKKLAAIGGNVDIISDTQEGIVQLTEKTSEI